MPATKKWICTGPITYNKHFKLSRQQESVYIIWHRSGLHQNTCAKVVTWIHLWQYIDTLKDILSNPGKNKWTNNYNHIIEECCDSDSICSDGHIIDDYWNHVERLHQTIQPTSRYRRLTAMLRSNVRCVTFFCVWGGDIV